MVLPERLGPHWLDRSELLDPLVRPDEFFARGPADRHLSPEGFVLVAYGGFFVVALVAVTVAFAVLFPARLTLGVIARTLPRLFVLALLVGILLALLVVLYGALLHATSRLVGGTGAFSNTLAVAAYGLGPPVAVAMVLVALSVGYSLTSLAPDFSTVEAYTEFHHGAEAAIEPVPSVVSACWQWYVWTFGLEHARNLSTRRAAIAAGSVALVSLVWIVVRIAFA